MPTPSNKPHVNYERLEARISQEKKYLLKHAADLIGRTLTDFVIAAAYEAATRVIRENQQIRLTLEDQATFINALQHAPKPVSALQKAAKKYKKDVISK